MTPIKPEMTRLSFRCDRMLVEAVDAVRGDVPRERWLRRAIEEKLERGPTPTFPQTKGPRHEP